MSIKYSFQCYYFVKNILRELPDLVFLVLLAHFCFLYYCDNNNFQMRRNAGIAGLQSRQQQAVSNLASFSVLVCLLQFQKWTLMLII